jgi:16S rRNA (guanine527-N7)-methyltransferase
VHNNEWVDGEGLAKQALIDRFNVSRETVHALESYEELIRKWANQINLIGPSTIKHFWSRHILDCAQLLPLVGGNIKSVADFGTGAGLPGLIIARLLQDQVPDSRVVLVEASAKRCGFLREAARTLGVNVVILQTKIEDTPPQSADIVTARAFAPLHRLLGYSYPWAELGARLIFFKGEDVEREIKEASTNWSFQSIITPSVTDSRGCLIEISSLQPR